MNILGGRYRLEREIGSGGMGRVYEAFDESERLTVAVKLIDIPGILDADAASRLGDGIASLAKLQHPNLVQIRGISLEANRIAIAMELLSGSTLWHMIYAGIQLDALQRAIWQVAGALEYLHERGIVHGDIKASNIMTLTDGETKLLDYELAALGASVGGTPAYMSPEQRAGRPLDARSDIFSLAAVMKFAVGEYTPSDMPFATETGSLRRQPPGWEDPLVRAVWVDLIARAMAADPAHRYQSAGEMRQAIEALTLSTVDIPAAAAAMPMASPPAAEAEAKLELPTEPPTLKAAPEHTVQEMPATPGSGRIPAGSELTAPPPNYVPAAPPAFAMPTGAAPTPDEPLTLWQVPPRSALTIGATPEHPEQSIPAPGMGSVLTEERALGTAETIEMSAYYPKEIIVGQWYPFYAYVFVPSAASAVTADALGELASEFQRYRKRGQPATQKLVRGTLVTATPRIEGIQFNPPTLSIGFFEDVHRLDFRLRATGVVPDRALNGMLTFSVVGIIVADIPVSIFVGNEMDVQELQPVSAGVRPYDAIFCSYSHGDEVVVRRVERAYRALGME